MPLVTEMNGHTYRLQANINIYGPTYTNLYTSDDPAETVLTTTLMTGSYTAYLNQWTLERRNDAGTFEPVSAYLISDYYVEFAIYNQSSTTISFQFETDGVVVTIGEGQLNVTIGVTELPAACTVFGNDCGAGSWCPPPALTGVGIACVPEGSIPLGSPCVSPTDCVANSSCYNFGAGAVCAGLCPLAAIGTACAASGTCTQAGADCGVCVPEGAVLPGGGGTAGAAGAGGSSGFGGLTAKGGRGPGGAFSSTRAPW